MGVIEELKFWGKFTQKIGGFGSGGGSRFGAGVFKLGAQGGCE